MNILPNVYPRVGIKYTSTFPVWEGVIFEINDESDSEYYIINSENNDWCWSSKIRIKQAFKDKIINIYYDKSNR